VKVRGPLIVTVMVVLAMVGFAFWTASGLPAGTELPTHWNAAGQVDRSAPALPALMFPPVVALIVGLICSVVPYIEPMQDRLEASAPVMRASWMGVLLLMVAVQLMVASPALGWHLSPNLLLAILGGVLMVIGNALPKSRPGFFVGIRTPWTITDTDIWIATHRLGGKLMMLVGAVFVLVAFLPLASAARLPIIIAGPVGSVVVPAVYSWWLWHRKAKTSA
jgi:uncharacterized membrane protein